MKQQFIQALKNGQVPFSENEEELKKLPEELFEKFNADLVSFERHEHRWNDSYFNQKIVDLDFNFSKELVLHLIQVKKYIQYQPHHMKNKVASSPDLMLPPVEMEKTKEIVIPVTSQAVEKERNFAKPNLLDFKPNERLVSFLQEGDVGKIRSYLMSMLNNRRLSLEELFKSIWYVNEHKPSIFMSEENSAFVQAINNNEATWDIEYFNLQQVYLNKNFSLARLLHLANVREALMKRGDSNFQQIGKERCSPNVDEPQQKTQEKATVQLERNSDEPSKATTFTESTTKTQPPPRPQPQHHQNTQKTTENGFVKTVAIVGGAVLALAAILFSIFK